VVDRRIFIAALTGALVGFTPLARAQRPTKVWRIGVLVPGTSHVLASSANANLPSPALVEACQELGYAEGRNVVTGSNPIVAAAKRATATIPIVMVGTFDPVGSGLVANLARPGGNVTGLCTDAGDEMSGKNLGLLAEIVPGLSRVGVLRQAGYQGADLEAAARRLNMELHVADVNTIDELESAFQTMRRKQVGAVLIRGPLFYGSRQQLGDMALKYRLPTTHALKEYAQAGLLLTYGANLPDLYRRAARYVDRIVKGAKPSDLPVEQPTKFELVINLVTAKVLGLTIPQSLVLRADEVIR